MMPTPCSLTSSLALLVLLGTVRAGPFSPRFNITRPGPRPPPQPGGHTAEPGVGSPSAQLYEHTVEGGEKQVVFTHRINLPPSAGCGCPPGTEPPAPASEVQSLKVRLEILEELVQGLKEQCTGGCCPVTAKAGTGQTDTRSLCSLHGVFDLSRCACSCEPGWGGPTCSDPTDAPVSPSSSPSCPDDCNDQGRCVRGRCECFPGYTGPSCSWPSCPGDCHGRGRCVQGVCVCRPGFSGADCSLRACPRGCSQKGRCEDGRCVCNPGYTGDDCGVKSCPRDCSQRGRCENGRCVCNPGYTGDDCGARSCPRGCSQKGRCEDGRCVCEPGYTGADCGSRSCPWDCGEGGRCVDGRCVCWPGYAGDDCSRRTCPRDCHGRGRCEDGECLCDAGYSGDDCGVRSCPGDCSQRGRCEDGRCVCWPGYTGPDCGAKSCPRDCRGRGRCEAGVCVCHPGYGGDDCGVRSCPGDCRGRGRCESGRCVCWPGYTGRDCGVRACPGDCRGRGRCVDGRCICNPGFAGDDCGSRRCPGDCRGRGRCEDGVCVCDAGYQGEDCGARSCPGGCRGRGQCLDGRCVCDDGYEGEDCGVRRCPRDCSQRGVCQDGVCACWEGYAGEDCGLRTCPSNCHGRGRCEEGRCVCDSGYTGPTCGVRTCPSDCRGHGRCVQGVCVCHPGYSGPDCGQDEPPASACPGGCGPRELCREGRCVCVEGFRGPDCAIQTCPADCLGRGECLEGSCVCQEGYAGEDCSEEIPAIENMRMHLLEETTVRTEWTRGPGTVDAYEIQFIPMFSLLQTEGMSPPFTARVPSSASAYDQRGLAPGQEYQVTVRALRGTSWGPPASKTITTMIDGPQDLRVVAVTPTTLDLSWLRPQAEVDRFVVSYVSAGNQRVRLEVPPEADRALLTDLMPGVEYVVTVTAERGPAVSYPASIRANTAPGHYSYPEVRPPPPSPQPRPGPQPSPPLLPPRPRRPSRPAEEVGPESRLPPSPPQPPRRPWGNLTAELGRFRGSVQDLERHLRARGYPLRANQTYTAVARHIHEYLLRRQAAPPAPPPRRPHPTASPNAGARKRDSSQGSYDRGTVPRHPKPEVLGFSADGTLLVSLDGLRGHFERMVLRWRPELPADGPGGELTVPGTSRTASLPNLKPSTTYHVEVHGVRAGQTSKSYAFVTTTGSSPTGFLGATDEPPPSGPSTTQGAQAPTLQHRPQELGELRVLGRDMTGRLHVTWTAQPDTFAHFQLTLQVPEGSWVHEELLPGDVHEALVPSPPPGVAYELTLHGVLPSGEPSSPLTYHGIKEKPEKPEKPLTLPRLGELTVTDAASSSLTLHWTVSEGEFDSFVIQYKDRDGPQVVPVEGSQREALITNLELNRKYKFVLYGMVGKKKHGPLVAEAKIVPQSDPISETSPRLGKLWVTDPTPDSLHLSWTVPEGQFDSFLVQYRGKDGQPQVIPVEGPERSATVSQLAPDHKYRFTLFGIANRKRHGPLMAEGTTAPEKKPGHPEPLEQPLLGKLTVNGATPDSLVLSWTVDQGSFDSFMVQYKDAQGQPQAVPVRGHENTVTIRGLESNRKYKMNLYGLHGRHRVGPVSVVASTAPQEVMETPTEPPSTEAPEPPEEPLLGKLTVTGSSQDSLSLSWTVPQGHFDRFLVQYKNGDGQPKVVRVPGTQDWVTISGLEPDHKYKVNLYGFHNGQRVGPISATGVTATEEKTPTETEVTPTEPPSTEAPESPEEPLLGELTVTGSSQDSLSLSWTVPQGHFDRFLVQYKNGDGQPKVVRVPGTQDWVTISGLEPDHKYKVNLYGFHNGQRVGPISATGVTATEEKTPTETEVTPTEPPSTEAPESPEEPLLGELTVTGSSQDSLSLSWTVPQGHFDRFLVQYKNGDGQPKVVRVPGTQDWVTISGLEPDHKYKMNLYGFHNGQRVGPISAFGVTDAVEETPTPTEPPSTEAPEPTVEPLLGELTVTGSSQDSLSLSWTVPQGHFDSFTIQYKDRDGQPQVVRVGGEEREVTVQGLDAGRKYKMHLYGLHGGQRVGPASTVGVTASLPTEPPVALSLGELTVVSVASDTVHLSWTVAQGPFDSFLVQYKDSQGQPQAVPVDGSLREVIVSGLDPARKYKFLLFGLQDEKKHGPVSTEAKTLPDKKPSPRLGDLTVTDVTPDSVGLLWTVPEGEFDSFVVQYKDKDRQPQVVPVAADQRKVTIPGLEPKKKYKFLLYGLAGRKRLGPVSAEGTTAPLEKELPPLPRLGELTLTDETPDSIHLSWTVAQGPFDSFVVQYRGTDGQPRAVPVAADEREVTIEGLEAGKKYKFLLFGLFRGQRLGPISGLGATASAEDTPIPGIPATEAPEGPRLGVLTVNSVAPDALRLSWSVAQGVFESFVIQYRDTDGKSQALLVDGDQSTVLVSSLEPSTPYMFSLYGLHGGKRLGPISAEGITGPAPPAGEIPGEPRPRLSQLSVTDVTTSSLRLNWEAPPGAFDSFLLRFGVPSQSSLEPYPRPLLQRELTVPGSRRSAAIRDLRPGTLYNLTLYGLRGPHKADSIQGSARTLSPVLESPHDLQFSEIGETSAKVSWTPPPSRVDSFKVSYQLADGGEPQSVRVDSRAQTQTLKGLAPGTRYEVTVVSIRGFEESEPLTGFFTTVSDGPTKLQALNLTEGSTVLHWDPPQNPVDTYDVQVTAPEAPSLQASAPGSAVDYPLSGLELHTNYTAMVRGLRGSNFTSPANITFTTGLEAPRDLEAKEVTPRTALLTWTEPPDPPTGYLLSFNTPGEQTQEILLPGGVTSHRLLGLFPSTTYNAFLRAVWGESFSPPMPTSFTTGGLRIPFPRDCGEEMQNGISTSRTTTIFLNGNRERPLDVFCDMETDGGGWLVFQRRMDGKTDFWRDWEDYAHGFGNISREFWLGNEALHSLTSSGDYSLRVDLRAGDEAVFAHYDSFRVDSAAKYYQLHLEGYHGTAGDSMTYHSGSVFSARDRDPNNLLISCAVSYRGAWWYRNCHYANLNGLYGSTVDHQGVSWYYWKGFGFSVPFTEMKLRPRNYHPPAWGG
ncbi:tenascin-X isoform X21 [Erinaceus europaeus]|uniref:Tenascin-X isoform X21 n=1 Tax=Erinaceus europaeus TaxID=9365 RepID=A0ABM3X9K5_ERIEU|nr:tenascin-X isoform X21 [Erinaceus europaeus]